ncbi:hypothetical protein [Sediminicoccus sp. KRV36]|uniref:hypothetical protein n=1 Tax=Sediminicoccus sp. KRV36 TaxID=3133721 RepID=UPI00200D4639|nr:hypothetical protein [Sediminicoccus rosea]UPY37564.1 hypothetical protein LHU95_02420 [Sediminicoccus rosea]
MRGWMLAGVILATAGAAGTQGAAGAAGAQPAAQRPERGTLLSAEAGDIACYLQIRDEAGRSERWMAAFELCEGAASRIGQSFLLRWRAETVQHPSCQGDTGCRRSERVMLITGLAPAKR